MSEFRLFDNIPVSLQVLCEDERCQLIRALRILLTDHSGMTVDKMSTISVYTKTFKQMGDWCLRIDFYMKDTGLYKIEAFLKETSPTRFKNVIHSLTTNRRLWDKDLRIQEGTFVNFRELNPFTLEELDNEVLEFIEDYF